MEQQSFRVQSPPGHPRAIYLCAQKTAMAVTARSVFRLGPRKRHGGSPRGPSPSPLGLGLPWRCLYLIYGTPRKLVLPS